MNKVKKINWRMAEKRKYRLFLIGILFLVMTAAIFLLYWKINQKIPNEILLFENRVEKIDFAVPFMEVSWKQKEDDASAVSVDFSKKVKKNITFSMAAPVSMTTGQSGSFYADAKLFGYIPCKRIRFDVIKEQKVCPVGKAVGLYIHARGLMVLGTGKVDGKNNMSYTPSYEILQTGDYIYQINGKKIATIQDISQEIQKNGKEDVILGVYRGGNDIQVKIKPILSENNQYLIGAWLREDTEGIGTLTFVTQDNKFGALGHGITDVDTGLLINLQNGGLYTACLDHVVSGEAGAPGELVGCVRLGREERIGTIEENTALGITGTITRDSYRYQEKNAMYIGRKQEIHEGKAIVRCQLGERVTNYEVEIEKINLSSKDNKGLEIYVTDPDLLKKTGGIVQGMFTSYNGYNTRKTQ